MSRILRRMPLMAKLLTLAILPIVFATYLTSQLYIEKSRNLNQVELYLDRIDEIALISRLIDQLQVERRFSVDYALRNVNQDQMLIQRPVTDSLLKKLHEERDQNLKGFMNYAFIDNLDSVRKRIDRKEYRYSQVMHFFASAAFRFSTLNRTPSFANEFLSGVYDDLTVQKLLSEIITYQSIIGANIYNILYTKQSIPETLAGSLPAYDIYKAIERELLAKASPASLAAYQQLKQRSDLKPVQDYLAKVFSTFQLDTSYTYQDWRVLSIQSLNQLREQQMEHLEKAEQGIAAFYEKEISSRNRALIFLILFSAVLIAITIVVLIALNKSLNEIRNSALQLSYGQTDINLKIESKDAIGSLASSIREIDAKNNELSVAAQQIGRGNFSTEIKPRSHKDRLGNALVKMRDELLLYTSELQRSKEEFEKLADFMPQIVWTADLLGKATYFNQKWYEITGAKKDFNDQGWVSVIHPDDVGVALNAWYRSVEKGIPYEIEYRLRDTGFGNYRWFLGRAVPITNGEGEIVKWFGTATDIHDQKLQSERLEELVAQRTLELNRSNEDLQQFAHVASHDLKEPLRKISTFSHRLEIEFADMLPEKGRSYIEKLRASSQRMAAMIDSILNYSVVNATEQVRETVDLTLVVENIKNDLELVIIQKDANITYEKLPLIKGVPTLLYQLFYNLINNALKFSSTERQPSIVITAKKVSSAQLDRLIEITKAELCYHISIADNGIGFNQEYADKMFNVFARLNARDHYEGTGLGLALCKKIVHRHNGAIYAEGKEGVGSTFHIILPAS